MYRSHHTIKHRFTSIRALYLSLFRQPQVGRLQELCTFRTAMAWLFFLSLSKISGSGESKCNQLGKS